MEKVKCCKCFETQINKMTTDLEHQNIHPYSFQTTWLIDKIIFTMWLSYFNITYFKVQLFSKNSSRYALGKLEYYFYFFEFHNRVQNLDFYIA